MGPPAVHVTNTAATASTAVRIWKACRRLNIPRGANRVAVGCGPARRSSGRPAVGKRPRPRTTHSGPMLPCGGNSAGPVGFSGRRRVAAKRTPVEQRLDCLAHTEPRRGEGGDARVHTRRAWPRLRPPSGVPATSGGCSRNTWAIPSARRPRQNRGQRLRQGADDAAADSVGARQR